MRLRIEVSEEHALKLPKLSESFPILPPLHLAVGLLLHSLLEFIHMHIYFPDSVVSQAITEWLKG